MKFTALLLLAAALQVSARGFSQRVTLVENDITLRESFKKIERQTGYVFLYNTRLLSNAGKVNVRVKNASLAETLEELLQDLPLTYQIVDKTIVIKAKTQTPTPTDAPVVYRVPVEGRILDAKTGEPVVGASISVKGVKGGAVSDKEGRFNISAVPGNTLVISFVGYESQEVKITAGNSPLVIKLAVSVKSMNDMVVTGIFSRPKQNFTGASSSFTAEDLSKVTNNNVLTALKALDPSFQLPENINLGSNPNTLPDVQLRGGNSLPATGNATTATPFNYTTGINTPLFILDGFEVSLQRISDLDMNRIAKVDILKDAAATSIYGSRAANGVIVIETVRPQDGKLRFSYNANLVVETPDLTSYNLLNAQEKLDIETLSGAYKSVFNATQNTLNTVYNARLAEIRKGAETDWLAQPVRTGVGQKHNIYIEGGGNNALYGISATYDKRSGVMKGSDRTTTTANTYLSYRVKNFIFRNDLTLAFNKSNNSPYGSFWQYGRLSPYWTPYDSVGNMKLYLEDIRDAGGNRITLFDAYDNLDGQPVGRPVNPLYNASLNVVNQATYNNLMNNFLLQWQALNWLRFTGRFSYQRQNDESDAFLPAQHTSFVSKPTFEKGTYTKGYGRRTSLEGMVTADMNKRIDKHLFFGTLGLNVLESKYNTQSFQVQGFPNPRLDQLTLGNRFPDGSKPTGTESITRTVGLVANGSYAYDSRYLLDLSYRLDGSSQFGADKRNAPFWSAGMGWNLHNEAILRNNSYINRLKLRYSFGYTGSQNFPSYLGINTSRYYTNQEYRGVIGSNLLVYGNPMLAWQKTQKNNWGTDITAFRKLDITANYFIERTQGSIANISTAPSTGFSGYSENLGDVVSKGWELSARYNIITRPQSRDNWSVFINAFAVKSTIEKISNTLAALNKRADTLKTSQPVIQYAEGQSVTAIWAVKSLGIDPSTGEEIFLSRDGNIVGTYDPRDRRILGDSRPKVEGTFGTNLELKGIGFNIIFRFRYGGEAFNQTLIQRVENVNPVYYNVDRRVLEERWKKPGDQSFFKGLVDQNGNIITTPTYSSSRFIQKDNLLSCESVSLFYRFSEAFNKRLHVQNSKIAFYTTDLFRLSSIKRERGLDYPFGHIYTLQLQTTF